MDIDQELAAKIEALSRPVFRATVNPTRRATLAIGALVLSWGQFDSTLGWQIKELREHHLELGLSGFCDEHPTDQFGQLRLLRRLIGDCAAQNDQMQAFDKLRTRIQDASRLRDDIVHGAYSLSNPTELAEDLSLICMPARKARRTPTGTVPAKHEFIFHRVSKIFEVADDLFAATHQLSSLIRVVRGLGPLLPLEDCY